jgi:hypothetical protein
MRGTQRATADGARDCPPTGQLLEPEVRPLVHPLAVGRGSLQSNNERLSGFHVR